RWRKRSPVPWPARSADCPPSQQARQQSKCAQQRPAPLPRLEDEIRPSVPIDLPGQIIDAIGKGEAGLHQPQQSEQLAPPTQLAPPSPRRLASAGPDARPSRETSRFGQPFVAIRIGIDEVGRPRRTLRAQL